MASSNDILEEEPPMRTIDFSDKPAVMQVSAALRRLWLIDPDSLEVGDHQDKSQLQSAFRNVMHNVGNWIAETPPSERWNDEVWKARTEYKLLDPPEGSQAEIDSSEGDQGPLFSPFRRAIYGVYDHVFWDVYNSLKEETDVGIGEFEPPATVVMVLTFAEDGSSEVPHFFPTDTFVYPVWIAPGTTLTFSVDGKEETLTPEGQTWRYSLWFRAGKIATATPKSETEERRGKVAAVMVMGQCAPRLLPTIPLEDHTIGAHRRNLTDAQPWAKDGKGEIDPGRPQTWPEADHLARAIFLKAGDAVDRCVFDEEFADSDKGEEQSDGQLTDVTTPNEQPPDAPLYSPLPAGYNIRILVLEPAPAAEDELQTRLEVVSLDDKPRFEAISYTWGHPSDMTMLNCNGSTVKMPRNLESALRRLRYTDRPRHVWADSVCINQQDIPERGQQVSIMRNIYLSSERVLVWLGLDEHDEAATAFAAVCDIVRAWRPEGDRVGFEGYSSLLEPMEDDDLASIRTAVDEKAWAALRTLFELNYFRRFWIIQELALGSSAVVFWGQHRISWGLIGICAAWMMSSGWYFSRGEPITAAYNTFLIYVLPLAKRSGISPFSKLDLSVVLGTTMGRFDSTDARDRIYALLGMPFAGNDPEAELLLKPDYSQDLRSVYIQGAQRILEQDKHLRILSAVQHGAELDLTYPSWVPKWHEPLPAEPLGLRDEQGYYANGGELFCPTAATFSSPSSNDDNTNTTTTNTHHSLTLPGLVCSTITSTSAPLERGNLHLGALPPGPHRTALSTLFASLNSEQAQVRASWSATLEKFTLFGFADPAVQAAHHSSNSNARAVAVTGQPGKYGMRAAAESLDGERAQTDHLGEFLLYWRERAGWRGGERVFVMEDGREGLGPAAAREGDVVVVLFGGVVPFVLRPCEGEEGGGRFWRLVGECFVPGLMQGEAVERAGLLAEGTFDRDEGGALRLTPTPQDEEDPRLTRKVGEHGIVAFEIR
ncbi:heterokaryon incompatibility protein-domain-containing protein [Chaetomium fimeti]|uniref:Heterokaryon incompatibility protein-domain-containing protein n=1 Tax=Chaetomium fimeti TaxID=1854472 RepID=A0AAE0LWH2_9PEZI|nr:heterokaryon incompatibility protein-domain-containing protein [Chaetomium fimeti]